MKIKSAKISFNANGTPVADAFDDVYFSNESGIDETEYVFIETNNLAQRWRDCESAQFVIAETGFGTGLNFLVCLSHFKAFKRAYPSHPLKRLYFISTEKYPLTRDDLTKALNKWPELTSYAKRLLCQYPILISGQHRLVFDNEVILDLNLGDAQQSFEQIHCKKTGLIDAWFLDGFAPNKNESMWTETLFCEIARLSKKGASFATFTAAGAVKRGLAQVGFTVAKKKGFGRKREMLYGEFNREKSSSEVFKNQHPTFYRYIRPCKEVTIVGGGIASATLAVQLVRRGVQVTLFCKDAHLAQGASGNLVGGFYPQLNAQAGINSQIQIHAFLYAHRFYESLSESGFRFKHDWCGVLQLGFNPQQQIRLNKLIDNEVWPEDLVNFVTSEQASHLANIEIPHDGLFIKKAGWISPPSLVVQCIEFCRAHSDLFKVVCNAKLEKYETASDHVHLCFTTPTGELKHICEHAVITVGSDSVNSIQQILPFRNTRGQVEFIKANSTSTALSTVLCHKGYMTPALDGLHAMGSTYVKNDDDTQARALESKANMSMHLESMAEETWVSALCNDHTANISSNGVVNCARASVRCSTPDHLPLAGLEPNIDNQKALFSELYKAKKPWLYPFDEQSKTVSYLTALGSRGLTTAPLMAELLASQLTGDPLPFSNSLADALNPNRFLIRSLTRRADYP